MIIKEINITNFQCYYRENLFNFSRGANIIIGHNGSGKTKFFEALEWFFSYNMNESSLLSLVSEKRKKEALNEPNSTFEVSVRVDFENQLNPDTPPLTYSFIKSFNVEINDKGECYTTRPLNYDAYIEQSHITGERNKLSDKNAWNALDELFPITNRKFSLFKGESELEILKNEEAFKQLIGLYASSKVYEPYENDTKFFIASIEDRIAKESKKNERLQNEYRNLEQKITQINSSLQSLKESEDDSITEVVRLTEEQGKLINLVNQSDEFNTQSKKKADLLHEKVSIEKSLQTNFVQYLFDKSWFLKGFEKTQNKFISKIKELDLNSRELENKHIEAIGIKKGERLAALKLLGGATPLDLSVPSRLTMQELLDAELCKVCNRPAHKGSEAYEFIESRLKEAQSLLAHDTRDSSDEKLYKKNYILNLVSLANNLDNRKNVAIAVIDDIKNTISYNVDIRKKIAHVDFDIHAVTQECDKLLATTGYSEKKLSQIFSESNYLNRELRRANDQLSIATEKIPELKKELEHLLKEKESKDITADKNGLLPTRDVLQKLHKVVFDTKNRVYNEFIERLQDLANDYFYKINEGFFTGSIKILRSNKNSVSVKLTQKGQEFASNSSLDTSMNLAILFAINELTRSESKLSFPLIFDAPTSSFDDEKRIHFYNILSSCTEQTILLTKDFLLGDTKESSELSDEFKNINFDTAYTIQNHRDGFDSQDLSSLSTLIKKLEVH